MIEVSTYLLGCGRCLINVMCGSMLIDITSPVRVVLYGVYYRSAGWSAVPLMYLTYIGPCCVLYPPSN